MTWQKRRIRRSVITLQSYYDLVTELWNDGLRRRKDMENFVIAALFTWESSTYLSEDVQWVTLAVSVTRLDNLLHFGQLFKACGDNYFAQITHILGNYCLKSLTFLVESFLGNFYRHLVTFTGHTDFNLLVQKLCFVPRHLLLSFYSTFFISILSHSSRPKVNIIVLIDFCSRLTFCLYKFRINS